MGDTATNGPGGASIAARDQTGGSDQMASSADPSSWKRLFNRQLNVSTVSIAGLLAVLGLAVLALDLTVLRDSVQTVFLEVSVSLILFGITTLLVTVAVSDALESRLQISVKEVLDAERDEIVRLTEETRTAVRETQKDLEPLGGNWRTLGLQNVFLTRSDALDDFGQHIRNELRRADAQASVAAVAGDRDGRGDREDNLVHPEISRLWIAASSMKGLLEYASTKFDGLGLFTWAARLACDGQLDLRVIMTHPDYAQVRAKQEDRGPGAIPEEIEEAVRHLRQQEVPPKHVRVVLATPTVFAIATRDDMLLNPYPYSQEAYRSFTLTVRRSQTMRDIPSIDRDIFEQYERRHFIRPWDTALPLGAHYEIPAVPDVATRLPAVPPDAPQPRSS